MIDLPVLSGISGTVYCYGNVLYNRNPANPKQLRKSLDGGLSWINLGILTAQNIGVVIECANGNILVSQDADYWADPPGEWWTSTDGGMTFTKTLTYAKGGIAQWSYDVKGNEVVVGQYGQYDSKNVYYSSDGGLTWSLIFTQPEATNGSIHIHAVHFDQYLANTIYVSSGDSSPVKGIWYTRNNGSSWTKITDRHQPTFMLATATYLFLFEDLEGRIHRIDKTALFAGSFTYKKVYTHSLETEAELGKLSFYAAGVDLNGNIYAGGVAYGESNTANNNLDAALLVSWNSGADWRVVKSYPRNPTTSSGPAAIAKVSNAGILYIGTNNPNATEVLDTSRSDLAALFVALPRKASTAVISGTISVR